MGKNGDGAPKPNDGGCPNGVSDVGIVCENSDGGVVSMSDLTGDINRFSIIAADDDDSPVFRLAALLSASLTRRDAVAFSCAASRFVVVVVLDDDDDVVDGAFSDIFRAVPFVSSLNDDVTVAVAALDLSAF